MSELPVPIGQGADGVYIAQHPWPMRSADKAALIEEIRGACEYVTARVGRTLTTRELRDGINVDLRDAREREGAKRRMHAELNPTVPDTRTPERRISDEANALADAARLEKMDPAERYAIETARKADEADRAAAMKAERQRIAETPDFRRVHEQLSDLLIDVRFDALQPASLREAIEHELAKLQKFQDTAAAAVNFKMLQAAAKSAAEADLAVMRSPVNRAEQRLAAYADSVWDSAPEHRLNGSMPVIFYTYKGQRVGAPEESVRGLSDAQIKTRLFGDH